MRMQGKTVLITGANSGVGYATARKLAEYGAEVIMVCRNSFRGNRTKFTAAFRVSTCSSTMPALFLITAS